MKTCRKLVNNRPYQIKYRDDNLSNYIRPLIRPQNTIKDAIFYIFCAKTVQIQVKLVKTRGKG